jgi:IS5 family transposase
MNRAKACTRKLRTQLGRVLREIERQVEQPTGELQKLLATAHRIHAQQRHDKNKIYSVHEPEVECIAKAKADRGAGLGAIHLPGMRVAAGLHQQPATATCS